MSPLMVRVAVVAAGFVVARVAGIVGGYLVHRALNRDEIEAPLERRYADVAPVEHVIGEPPQAD